MEQPSACGCEDKIKESNEERERVFTVDYWRLFAVQVTVALAVAIITIIIKNLTQK